MCAPTVSATARAGWRAFRPSGLACRFRSLRRRRTGRSDELAVHGDAHQATAVGAILEWMNDHLDGISGIERRALPSRPAEPVGAAAFDGPLHGLTGRHLDQYLHPDVGVGPLDFLDRSH